MPTDPDAVLAIINNKMSRDKIKLHELRGGITLGPRGGAGPFTRRRNRQQSSGCFSRAGIRQLWQHSGEEQSKLDGGSKKAQRTASREASDISSFGEPDHSDGNGAVDSFNDLTASQEGNASEEMDDQDDWIYGRAWEFHITQGFRKIIDRNIPDQHMASSKFRIW